MWHDSVYELLLNYYVSCIWTKLTQTEHQKKIKCVCKIPCSNWMAGGLIVYNPFNCMLVSLSQWKGDNKRLCAMEPSYGW